MPQSDTSRGRGTIDPGASYLPFEEALRVPRECVGANSYMGRTIRGSFPAGRDDTIAAAEVFEDLDFVKRRMFGHDLHGEFALVKGDFEVNSTSGDEASGGFVENSAMD